ncbi:MAG: TRAP transporter substrate-binding protein [Bradyrhizobiaceae bacterium]|nr:TRAP transporter substrate-binding protein [Bradyrhizobiaceae bacterium]
MTKLTRRSVLGGIGAAGTLAAPSIARAQTQKWRMVTSWPRRLPGPGVSAERVAERIKALSGGRIEVQVYAAGEVVPAFEVLDAVGGGAADLGHTAAFFWQGKMPAANFYTTVPFGLTPDEHVAWVEHGGGQALWDELYAPFGAKPFMAGNTGVCMGGWFRREIKSLADLKGLKLRSLGLGGEIFRRLGATAVSIPPGEIFQALQSGVVDGAEFTTPASDIALGLWRVAPHYAYPGFNKPNGTGECIVSRRLWEKLDSEARAIVAHACAAEASSALAEFERANAEALEALVTKNNVKLFAFSDEIVRSARPHADAILADVARGSAIAKRIHESYTGFRARNARWSKVSIRAVLEAREI